MQAFLASEIHHGNRWAPFRVEGLKPEYVRPLRSVGGVEDRLRLVAFAELQARDLFQFGVEHWGSLVPDLWIESWRRFAEVENRHAQMLLDRMMELGFDPGARTVSDKLWRLCEKAETPEDFLFLLSSAEERGMEAGFVLGKEMAAVDEGSAQVFLRIAEEEIEHVQMATQALSPWSEDLLREKAREISRMVEGELLASGQGLR